MTPATDVAPAPSGTGPAPKRLALTRIPARLLARRPVRLVALGAGCVLLALVVAALGERLLWHGKVLPGVELPGLSLAGKSEGRALDEAEALARTLETQPVRARAGDVELSVDPHVIDLDLDAAGTVRDARRAGRKDGPPAQLTGVVLRRFRADRVDLRVSFDEERLDGVLDAWIAQTARGVEDGSLHFEGARVVVVPPEAGIGIERAEARRRLVAALERAETGVVELPVGTVEPAVGEAEVERVAAEARDLLAAPVTIAADGTTMTLTPAQLAGTLTITVEGSELVLGIDVERLRSTLGPALAAIEIPPVDAGFAVEGTTVSVVPSVPGKLVDLESAVEGILAGRRSVTARLEDVEPERNTAWAAGLNITELVSSFTTHHPCCQSRVTNIHQAADIVDGTIVEPGQVFSLNETLGPRTPERGVRQGRRLLEGRGVLRGLRRRGEPVHHDLLQRRVLRWLQGHHPHAPLHLHLPLSHGPRGDVELGVDRPQVPERLELGDPRAHELHQHLGHRVVLREQGGAGRRGPRPDRPRDDPPAVEHIDTYFLYEGEELEVEKGYPGYRVEVNRIIKRPGQEDQRERFFTRYEMLPTKIARGIVPPTTTTTTLPPGEPPPDPSTTVPPTTTVAPPPTGGDGGGQASPTRRSTRAEYGSSSRSAASIRTDAMSAASRSIGSVSATVTTSPPSRRCTVTAPPTLEAPGVQGGVPRGLRHLAVTAEGRGGGPLDGPDHVAVLDGLGGPVPVRVEDHPAGDDEGDVLSEGADHPVLERRGLGPWVGPDGDGHVHAHLAHGAPGLTGQPEAGEGGPAVVAAQHLVAGRAELVDHGAGRALLGLHHQHLHRSPSPHGHARRVATRSGRIAIDRAGVGAPAGRASVTSTGTPGRGSADSRMAPDPDRRWFTMSTRPAAPATPAGP
ncbi:MAG: peptidoglycan binding domain-containing protein [Acidimicrobiia bacterium]|nr:peptidoglycan binding domain-containing protein [Acidimicrobiia bacterium]